MTVAHDASGLRSEDTVIPVMRCDPLLSPTTGLLLRKTDVSIDLLHNGIFNCQI
jgi:hypothetical protein